MMKEELEARNKDLQEGLDYLNKRISELQGELNERMTQRQNNMAAIEENRLWLKKLDAPTSEPDAGLHLEKGD